MAAGSGDIIELVVPDQSKGLRFDRFVADGVSDVSRRRIQALIKTGNITINGEACRDASTKLRGGEVVRFQIPEAVPVDIAPEDIPLTIVHEDDDLIVIDKPAGLVAHPAPGHASGTMVNALLGYLGDTLSGIGGVQRPGIVHRLDKDTSGLLVVAKNDKAHIGLSEQFAAHGVDGRLERTYQAIVWGQPVRKKGRIDAPLGRSPNNRRKIAIVSVESGRRAVTHYVVEERFAIDGTVLASRLSLNLETGRTHQIRVHLMSIGHPVLGDQTYGTGFKASQSRLSADAQAALADLGRQALHASTLAFVHPLSGDKLSFESPLPADIDRLIQALR